MSRYLLFAAAAPLALFLTLAASSAGAVQSGYAGSWSVVITTSKGDCDKAYRYSVTVDPGGTINYGGSGGFKASGRVERNGAVEVRISRGDQAAQGSGRLLGNSGRGTWSLPSGGCSGTWRADRRG
jgi:hypothetical protein